MCYSRAYIAQPHLKRAVAPLLTPHDLPPHVKCSASTPVCEGAKQYRTPTSEGACGGAELEVSSSENVPKDLRFSIGPDIKDALPGFSWKGCCLIAGWVCPGVSVSRKGCGGGVESGLLVVLVGGGSGGGSRAQSQAEKVKVGAVAFLAPAQGDIIGCRAFSLHVTFHLHNTAFFDTFMYNDILASLSIEYDPYEYDRFGDCRVTGAGSLQATPKGSTSPKDCVRRHCRKACGDHWVHLFTVFVHVTSCAETGNIQVVSATSEIAAADELYTPLFGHSRQKYVY